MPADLLLNAIQTGGPWALAMAALLWMGYKRIWQFTSSGDAVIKVKDERITYLETVIKEERADHRAELAAVRADYAAQVAREVGRVDKAWDSLDPLTEDLHGIVVVQEQQGRTLALLVNIVSTLRASGESSPPAGPPDPPLLPAPSRRR